MILIGVPLLSHAHVAVYFYYGTLISLASITPGIVCDLLFSFCHCVCYEPVTCGGIDAMRK